MVVQIKYKHGILAYLLVLLLFLLMWYIAGWSTDNWDWMAYEMRYYADDDISIVNTLDISFALVNSYFSSSGLTFIQFRQVAYFVFLSVIMFCILKFAKTPVFASILYFVVLFFRDCIILRNSLAFIFLIIAVFCFLSSFKYNKLLFILFWLISCTFHISFLFYGVLLLSNANIKPVPFFVIIILLGFFGSIWLSKIMNINLLMGLDLLQAKSEVYLMDRSYISLSITYISALFNYYVVTKFAKYNRKYAGLNVDLFKKVNLLLSSIIILTSVNMEFFRLFNNFFLINVIVLLNICKTNKVPSSGKLLLFCWVLWSFLWITVLSGVGPQVGLIINSI